MSEPLPTTRMIADVGGTNTRMALFDPTNEQMRSVVTFVNRQHHRFEDVITQWLAALNEPQPRNCCIAVAAPPSTDHVAMTNMDWAFSCSELASRFGFSQMRRLNDFESNAFALPHLGDEHLQLLYPGTGEASGRLATLGPGTGLGGAFLDYDGGRATSYACEPGHMGLSPGTDLELELFRLLLTRHPDIYAELLVSGPGLQRLYLALGEIRDQATEELSPVDISTRAIAGQDPLCVWALDTFCALLGSACGNFLLACGAYGGLYLAGGILPGMIPYLRASQFQQRLVRKGAMTRQLEAIPVYVITTSHPGLIGAAHAPL